MAGESVTGSVTCKLESEVEGSVWRREIPYVSAYQKNELALARNEVRHGFPGGGNSFSKKQQISREDKKRINHISFPEKKK